MPGLGAPAAWVQVAYFSVWQKTGTATYLDIWDADHFDYFTDTQRDLTDCRVCLGRAGAARRTELRGSTPRRSRSGLTEPTLRGVRHTSLARTEG